ncbi:hypothetical protein GIB67_006393 [Kingdonia uniflora]|uniref:Polymerase nucleotidyl transferase domain-containing protein n=1 Tax=Kingdonia uniflora TaxID=39325 RepID=A0A7J7P0P7_9MAGN|nr:hypothetical protein GIB67_006393 [Kingdonia uniflora]
MGSQKEELGEPSGLLPNSRSVDRVLDSERWLKAEERTGELIASIQPNQPSEELRNAVAEYVQRQIMKCFPCQVFIFGSVPLKTYLPDGDIDLTAFSKNQSMKDTWANEVRILLENEEKSETAEFRVKEVQYIQAEVKLIKCLVENIVVDISFNQLGGLCTLCFLEEVDHLIKQNHLFKRSIILIKAWCYYESRILGAHHGLISTYALETLVLYIFNVFNNSFSGPLEVLYRFLDFFSNFDWENFCVSLEGPVPTSSLPEMAAEPPRKDSGELLLSKAFLDGCNRQYTVFPSSQEIQGQPFISKHFNVIDPLRANNNLGRSVSKGNFFRIRSAFSYGAKRLSRLLDCPKENIISELDQFFMNTWERHGSGHRPDAPSADLWRLRREKPDLLDLPLSHGYLSRSQPDKGYDNVARIVNCSADVQTKKDQRRLRTNCMLNDLRGRYQFARTHSSPELSGTLNEVSSPGRRNRAAPEMGKNISRRRNFGSEVAGSRAPSSTDDPTFLKHKLSHETASSNTTPFNHHDEGEELPFVAETMEMHQEEQDLMRQWRYIMASSGAHGLSGQAHLPTNFSSQHLPLPISPSALASMGYSQGNISSMIPSNFPLMEPPWGSEMQFSHGFVPSPLSHYIHSVRLASSPEETSESGTECSGLTDMNQGVGDRAYWHEHDVSSAGDFDPDNSFENLALDAKQQSTSAARNYISSSRVRDQRKVINESRVLVRDDRNNTFHNQNNRNEGANLRFFPNLNANSSRSKPSSESSGDGFLSVKVSKSTRDKRGRKTGHSVSSTVYGKGKSGLHYEGGVSVDLGSSTDDENGDWVPPVTMGTEVSKGSVGSTETSLHPRSHQMPNLESAEMSGSDSMLPIPPMLVRSGSQQQFAFYPTGPPVPFITMLHMHNLPNETGHREGSTIHFDGQSDQNFDSAGNLGHSEIFTSIGSMKDAILAETPEEHKSDILHSDFNTHYNNLQIGRYCQTPQFNGPLMYPSSHVGLPPVYIQGHFPWDGSGRPNSTNMNPTQFMGYGSRFVPVAPLQPGSQRPSKLYRQYGDEVPKYRGGTGTYLPNPKISQRERQSGTKNQRGGYYYDRNDNHREREWNWNSNLKPRAAGNYDRNDNHGEREWNWNSNLKPRAAGRNHGRNQTEKHSSRSERQVARHESFPLYHVRNGNYGSSNTMHNGSTNVSYGRYPIMGAANSNGPPAESAASPLVTMCSYDHNVGDGSSSNEQLKFGSRRPLHLNEEEASRLCHGDPPRGSCEQQHRFRGSSALSSPDQPSSPQLQRSADQRNYQLKDEDFPPLSCLSQEGNGGGKNVIGNCHITNP